MITSTNNAPQEGKGVYTIGRAAFEKISAVEGVSFSKELRIDFQTFEENGLSPQDRRAAFVQKYTH